MPAEILIVGLAAFVGLWLLLYGTDRASLRIGRLIAVGAVAAAFAFAIDVVASRSRPMAEREVRGRPIEVAANSYVSSTTCRACHPSQYASWHASFHRTMTQVATSETIVGDFESIDPRLADHLVRRGDKFFVRFGPKDSPLAQEHPIVMTTGSHHYQAYWYEGGQGRRVKLVPAVYLIEDQRWIPRDAAFLTPPNTQAATLIGEWNANCIKCHATHGQPRVANPMASEAEVIIDTHVAEFGIACEACHGPADAHVRASQNPVRRYLEHWSDGANPTIVQPARLDHRRSSEVCGQCHGIFEHRSDAEILEFARSGSNYRPGDDLGESRLIVRKTSAGDPKLLSDSVRDSSEFFEQRYWSDGMVRVSGREYNGLIESPCYQHGEMSCLSCHQMHKPADDPRPLRTWAVDQLERGMESNQACLQCHEEFADRVEEHTHHAASSPGSLCYNCHMPHTTYGLLKAIRSHQIDSPNVATSLTAGRPNACNLCHLDRTSAWTAEYLTSWYDQPLVELDGDDRTISAAVLWILRGDAGQRALVAWSFGWQPAQEASGVAWMPPLLAPLLEDPYDAVRYIALRSLRTLPGYSEFSFDFMSPPQERTNARRRAVDAWPKRDEVQAANGSAEVLLDEAGNVNESKLNRLLRERDDRPVNLAE
jgi:hypothetical protein